MSSAITNAGEALIALKQNQEAGLVIDKFILANVDGIDPAVAVDRTEGMPSAGDIVYEYTIPAEGKGYINPNQVVYSMLLTSDIGDFDFNWVGLYSSADDTVIAITYLPTLSKWATAHPTMGNALTRNFMLEYSGIKDVTNITVEASTWQIDFTTRLKGIDERERLSNLDIYGGACFFGDAYLVVNDGGTFKVQPGTAYVEGVRIALDLEQTIDPALPAEVFLDVALQPQGSDRVSVASIVYADPGDYQDGSNDNHYGQKIAEIAADGTVTDFRLKTLAGGLGGDLGLRVKLPDNITVTVGTGGDFATVTEAVAHLNSTYYPDGVHVATVMLLSGFEWTETLSIYGLDLSWVVISSVDNVVSVSRAAIAEHAYAINGEMCVFPRIDVQFEMDTSGTDLGQGGVYSINSTLWFVSGGFRNAAGINVLATGGGFMLASGCDFSGAGDDGVNLFSTHAYLINSDFSGSDIGVQARHGSIVNAQGTSADNCGQGFYAYMGASLIAYQATALNCTTYGFAAVEGGNIIAANTDASGAGTYGYRWVRGGVIDAYNSIGTLSSTANTLSSSGYCCR